MNFFVESNFEMVWTEFHYSVLQKKRKNEMPRSKRGSSLPRNKIVVTAYTDLWSYIARNIQQWSDLYSYLQHQWRADYFPRISITDINFVTFSTLKDIQLDSCTTPSVLDIAVHCSRGSFYANSYCASITRRNVYLHTRRIERVLRKKCNKYRSRPGSWKAGHWSKERNGFS